MSQQPPSSSPFDQQRPLPKVRHIIAVSSGKGGVGKSTVAVNLALALSKKNRVGLLDADIYGPSLPRMLGAINQKPNIDNGNRLDPIARYGLKTMSMGYLIDEGAAVVWRGPMLFKAMDQFLRDVNWGELDYLICDLPPGTGDIQLSLSQKVPVSGTVTVSTPQNLSLIDVKKSIDMWKRVGVRILGMVENMAYFVAPGGEKVQLFPKGELDSYLASQHIAKLVEVPFNPAVGMASEAGVPVVESYPSSDEAKAFFKLAEQIRELLPTEALTNPAML